MLKKITQLLVLILVAFSANGQRVSGTTPNANQGSERYIELVPPGTFFYEGFEAAQRPNLPTGWSSQSNASEGFISGTAGDAPGQTNANGFWPVPFHGIFAVSNDDACNCDKSQDRLLSPIINAAEQDQAVLRFSAFQNGSGSQIASVEIKAAGLPWLEVFKIPTNSVWQTFEVEIPRNYLKASFQFRFLYSDQGNYASGLAVDDVYLSTKRAERFSLEEFYSIDQTLEGSGQLYHHIPLKQARKARWKFGTQVANTHDSRKNARLNVEIDGPVNYDETTPDWLLGASEERLIRFPQNLQFSPYETGSYDITVNLSTDSVDQALADNVYSTSFGVSDSTYQRVNFGSNYSTGVWLQSPGERYGTSFYFHEPDSIRALLINLHPASTEGARYRVKIFSYDTLSSSFYSSGQEEITAGQPGSIVRVPVNRKISRGRKLFVIEKEAGSGNIVIAANRTQPSTQRNTLTKKVAEDWQESAYFPQVAVVTEPVGDDCSGHIQFSQSNESCLNANDGSIETEVLDQNSSITYNWSNGAGNVSDIDNLSPGLYDLFVTTGDGCVYQERFNILASDSIQIDPIIVALDSCSKSNGILDLNISGGFSPYDIEWNGLTGLETEKELEAGTYTIEISDSKGCSVQLTTELDGTSAIGATFNLTLPSCNDSNGVINMTSFGTPPFQYAWNTGDSTSALNNLPAGVYTITMTDSIGCETNAEALLLNDQAPAITLANLADIDCFGTPSGSIDINVGGGSSPYSYDWSNGAFTQDIENLTGGKYTLSLTDGTGCKAFFSEEVSVDAEPLLLNFNARGNYCWRDTSGILDPIISGGVQPYSFAWSTGSSASAISNLEAGTYSLTVTDDAGCTVVKSYNISDGFTFFVRTDSLISDTSDNGVDEGAIYVSTFGGTPPYQHIWNDSIKGEDLISVPNGQYILTVRDQLGCVEIHVITLSIGPASVPEVGEKPTLLVYPNPVQRGELIKISSKTKIKRGRLLDLHGRVVEVFEANEAQILNTSLWPSGSYILQIEDELNTPHQIKLIVR